MEFDFKSSFLRNSFDALFPQLVSVSIVAFLLSEDCLSSFPERGFSEEVVAKDLFPSDEAGSCFEDEEARADEPFVREAASAVVEVTDEDVLQRGTCPPFCLRSPPRPPAETASVAFGLPERDATVLIGILLPSSPALTVRCDRGFAVSILNGRDG